MASVLKEIRMIMCLNILFICIEFLLLIHTRSFVLNPVGNLWLLSILKVLESFLLTFKRFVPDFLHVLGVGENFFLLLELSSIDCVGLLLSSLGFLIVDLIGNLDGGGLPMPLTSTTFWRVLMAFS